MSNFIRLLILVAICLTFTQAFWSTKKVETKTVEVATPEVKSDPPVTNEVPKVEETVQTEEIAQNEAESPAGEEFSGEEEHFQNEEFNEEQFTEGRTDLHIAAADGNYDVCEAILGNEQTDIIHARDENGWQAIHEAVRQGHTEVVQLLIERGADIGAQTNSADTPLSVARSSLPDDHEVIGLLQDLGAPEGPQPEGQGEEEYHEEFNQEEDFHEPEAEAN